MGKRTITITHELEDVFSCIGCPLLNRKQYPSMLSPRTRYTCSVECTLRESMSRPLLCKEKMEEAQGDT